MQPIPALTSGWSDKPDLNSRVALVTGAGRGIGRAIAEALAEAGASIAALDLVEPTDTVAAVQVHGRDAIARAADVARRADVERAAGRAADRFGRSDELVN